MSPQASGTAANVTTTDGGITAPAGYRAAGAACGLKPAGLDIALVLSDRLASAAGLFTTNLAVAAPVVVTKAQLARSSGRARVIAINSKCANACTGASGVADAEAMVAAAAEAVRCDPAHVLIASTGVIGMKLDITKVSAGLTEAALGLGRDAHRAAAEAIMTTDVSPKEAAVRVDTPGGPITIGGMAKGAGMIEPNLATMLGFLTTDAAAEPTALERLLRAAAAVSFNAISVDGEPSNNDTVLMLANGASGITINERIAPAFMAGLENVCTQLAREIVRGGEGATKPATIRVEGAATDDDARRAARAIANSPLVKTALNGGDPNWGRLVAVAGRAGVAFDPDRTVVRIGGVVLYDGVTIHVDREAEAAAHLANDEVELSIDLGVGGACAATMWTCDFSADYVHINADYRT